MSVTRFLKKAKDIHETHRKEDEKPHEEGHDESNWLVAYADMMTLLCAFFIMMFSLSTLDKEKFIAVQKVIAEHTGAKYENPSKELHDAVSQVIDQLGVEKNVMVSVDNFGVTVTFQGTNFFDSQSTYLSIQAQTAIHRMAEAVLSQHPDTFRKFRLVVEGHSDSQPLTTGDFQSNWELASSRGAQVVHALVDEGFLPEQISLISYGDTRPLPSLNNGRTPAGEWDGKALEANRRVIIRILNPGAELFPWDEAANSAH